MSAHRFTSAKSWFVTLALWGTTFLLLALLVKEVQSSWPFALKISFAVFTLGISALLLWLWFGTYYRVSGNALNYRSGPLHGTIPISEIRKITLKKHLWSGLRPALGLHGLVIYYNRWDEIYFSPADQKGFLEALLEVNPEIEVEKP